MRNPLTIRIATNPENVEKVIAVFMIKPPWADSAAVRASLFGDAGQVASLANLFVQLVKNRVRVDIAFAELIADNPVTGTGVNHSRVSGKVHFDGDLVGVYVQSLGMKSRHCDRSYGAENMRADQPKAKLARFPATNHYIR
jgi:hypothetical protein